jgi:hypothetical protein
MLHANLDVPPALRYALHHSVAGGKKKDWYLTKVGT